MLGAPWCNSVDGEDEESNYTDLLAAREADLLARAAGSGLPQKPSYDGPPVFLGIDSEWVTQLEDGRPRNRILSYQVAIAVGDQRAAFIYYPGPRKEDRWPFSRLVSRALADARRRGVLDSYPDRLTVCGHFLRADLPTFSDFWSAKKQFDGLGKTFSAAGVPVHIHVDDDDALEGRAFRGERLYVRDQNRPHPIIVRFIDTINLAPGRGSLATIGALIGLPKLPLPDGHSYERMDVCLVENREGFEAYALRDAEITLEYGLLLEALRKEVGLRRLPLTLASFGAQLLPLTLKAHGLTVAEAIGTSVKKERYYNPRNNRYRTIRRKMPVFDRALTDEFGAAAYQGGRNESYYFGPTPVGGWADYDQPGAYTTCLAAIRPLNYSEARLSKCVADFELDIMGIARVGFKFPPDTRFPCLPVRTEFGLIYPLSGISVCTSPEIVLAAALGAEIEVLNGMIIPWMSDIRPFEEFTRFIQGKRKAAEKGSLEDKLWKEIGNSLYGKTAQGVREKRAFNPRTGKSEPLKPSALTNPLIAAYVTGLNRAVLSEMLAGVPANRRVVSATTDGFLTDAACCELRLDGPLCRHFGDIRHRLFGDRTVLEEKHRVAQVLSIKTRGQITAQPLPGHPLILAKAGVKPPCPADQHNAYMLDLWLTREPGQRHAQNSLISIRHHALANRRRGD